MHKLYDKLSNEQFWHLSLGHLHILVFSTFPLVQLDTQFPNSKNLEFGQDRQFVLFTVLF